VSRVVSLILAAGKGERIGGPKALLLWPSSRGGGKAEIPLAIAHAEARLAAESARALIVTRGPIVRALLRYVRPGIELLSSDAGDDLGPAGSIAFGIRRIGDASAVLITPVDTPPARAETVASLLARLEQGDPPPIAVRPRYREHAGHPVVARPSALDIYQQPGPPPLRDHLKTLGDRCVEVEVDDASVRLDLNTPADVIGVLKAMPRFLSV
jgi:molybdenum cofactor cytidylyltransferase